MIFAGDGDNRYCSLGELLARGYHGVVIGIDHGMFHYALKIRRRITDETIQGFKGNVLLVRVEKFRAPKFRVGKQILLAGATAREGEPLRVVRDANVIGERKI